MTTFQGRNHNDRLSASSAGGPGWIHPERPIPCAGERAILSYLAALAVLGTAAATLAGEPDSTIRVDANTVVNRITPYMYGSCIEDVNHEVYGGLYAQLIFGESFEEAPLSSAAGLEGWAAYGGQWSPKDGVYSVAPDAGAKVVRGEPAITDGMVECDMLLADKNGENAGLIVRVQEPRVGPDAWTGYEISLSAKGDYVRLGRHHNDFTLLRDAKADIEPDRWYRLRVELAGPKLRIFVTPAPKNAEATPPDAADAKPVLEFTDTEQPILGGRVGLRTWHALARFRNLRITAGGAVITDDLSKPAANQESVSGMWDKIVTNDAAAHFAQDADRPFNSNRSQRVELLKPGGTAGVANRGLNRWGLTVRENHEYAGRIYLRQEGFAGGVTVALQSADGRKTYAQQALGPVSQDWAAYPFRLKATGADTNARFALWIDQPGRVWVDQAYLNGTGDELFHGLPIRADIGNQLVAEGLTMLRYGGCMVNAPEYRWKKMIGDRDRRSQYKGAWYPHATNGFGIEDFLQFCEAAKFMPVFAINIEETPADAADLVEYLNGPPDTEWGKRRAENGHRAPYGLRYIQIGNEERTDEHYLERFKVLYDAMHPRDPNLQFIIGAWWEPDNAVTRKIVEQLNGKAALWDVHIGGDGLRDGDEADAVFSRMPQLLQQWAPGTALKACVLEENGGRHDLQRALGHAHILNTTQRHGDFVLMDCPANCLQPWLQNDNGWDQGQLFFTGSRVWGMPPYYAQQMAAANHLPCRVAGEVKSPADELDLTATRSEDGKTLVLKVVNIGAKPHRATVELPGFKPAAGEVWTLSGKLTDRNTPDAPDAIRPTKAPLHDVAERFEHEFPAYSFTILRLAS